VASVLVVAKAKRDVPTAMEPGSDIKSSMSSIGSCSFATRISTGRLPRMRMMLKSEESDIAG
jgi:hypothetical protein